jgi:hypothetical protein
VQSVSKDGSVFTLWTTEPAFDNTKGTVTFGGGATVPFTGKKTVLSVTFKGLKEGKADVSFTDGDVIAADGKGTSVLSDKIPASFTIGAATANDTAAPTDTPSPPSSAEVSLPPIPVITSPTHPDPTIWYKENTALFKWTVPRGVDNIRTLLDESPRSVPSISIPSTVTQKEFTDVSDGAKYFHIMFHNKTGWGTPAHWQVLIDKTPPEKFSIDIKGDTPFPGETTLLFPVVDKASGIAYYEISMDGASSTRLEIKDVPTSGYQPSTLTPGEHTVKISAYDKVGNTTSAEATFTVIKPAPTTSATGEAVVVAPSSPIPYWLSLIFLAICVFLLGMLYSERRKVVREKEQIKQESDEVADTLGKIFTALRDEIEEQMHTLSNKPNLSDFEREILERMKESLDISEEILDKEIEDVQKLLR